MRNFYSQDGEAEILIPAMDPSVQSAFQDTLTDFIKGAPSATALHQANDQNAAFRDTKTGMDTITRNGIDTSNTTLAKHFKDVIIILKMEHPEIVLSATNETKMIKAVETLTYVQKNGYVSSRKNIMSYQVCMVFILPIPRISYL